MNLRLGLLKNDECEIFRRRHDASFETQAKYFKDVVLPGFEDENEEEYNLQEMIANPECTVLSIWENESMIGGAIVEAKANHEYEIFEFFIDEEHQGKGIGKQALEFVEYYFEDATVFRLITPSQVVRNCVFYVNKCGYRIVKVIDFDKENNSADYLFEKRR